MDVIEPVPLLVSAPDPYVCMGVVEAGDDATGPVLSLGSQPACSGVMVKSSPPATAQGREPYDRPFDDDDGQPSFEVKYVLSRLFQCRPRVRGEYPPNLSILISGGKETNRDSLSKGD